MTKRLVAANTLYQLIARGISAFTSVLVTILVARYLSVIDFGQLVKVINYVTIFMMPIDFGLNAVVVRLITSSPSKTNNQLSLLASTRFAIAIFLALISIVVGFLLPGAATQGFTPLVKQGVLILSLSLLPFALIRSLNALFQQRLEYQFTLIAEAIASFTVLTFLYFALFLTRSILSILWGYTLGSLLAALGLLFVSKTKNVSLSINLHFNRYLKLISSSLPLGITLVIVTLTTRFDILWLSLTRSTLEVGYYGLAKRVFELLLVFPTFFTNALYPILVKRTDKINLLKKSLLGLLSVALLSIIVFYPAAPLITLIKTDFIHSIPLFRLLLFALPIFFITALLMWTLISLHQEALLPRIYFLSLLYNVIANLLTISRFGATAAAVNVFVSETIALFLLTYYVIKFIRLKTKN